VDYSSELKRPIIKAYRTEDIINWRESLVGGKTIRTLVVLHEMAEQDSGYALVMVDQWRELFLDGGIAKARLWQLDSKTRVPVVVPMVDADGNEVDEVIVRSSGAPLDFIPFVFVGSENNDSTIDPSPLYGMAKVNVAHFHNSADYEDSVFYVGQAQPWVSGLDVEWRDHLEKQGTIYAGSRAPMLLPVNGAYGFAQPSPNTMVKEAMDQKEAQMVALGARLIDKSHATKTATQAQGEREASTSILAMCVSNVSEAYQTAIGWCARYLDIELDVADTYKINQDFASVSSDAPTIVALVKAWQAGLMAKADVRAYFRRQGTIATERSDEDIDADLSLEPPPMADATAPAPGALPNKTAALLRAPSSAAAAAAPAPPAPPPLDRSPIVAAIREAKPAPIDLAALVEMVKAGQTQPAEFDSRPIADALRAGMEAVGTALQAFGTAVAALQPPSISVPIQMEPPAPLDMSAMATALQASHEVSAAAIKGGMDAIAAAIGAIKPPQVIQPRLTEGELIDDDGRVMRVRLN
jgi:hypothetical protein